MPVMMLIALGLIGLLAAARGRVRALPPGGARPIIPPPGERELAEREFAEDLDEGEPPAEHAPPPLPIPAPPPPVARDPAAAARGLAEYARSLLAAGRGAQLGTRGNPSETVREYQRDMGDIEPDGIYGPETRARGAQLGVAMPVRAGGGQEPLLPLPPEVDVEASPVERELAERELAERELAEDLDEGEPPAEHEPPPLPIPAPPPPVARDPAAAARGLAEYARSLLEAGRGAQLGTRGNPSETVREYQRDMGDIDPDGQYGPATRARGASLGVQMPIRS